MKALGKLLLVLALALGSTTLAVPASQAGEADPRWRFYTKDKREYRSRWYAGAHRIMIPFGCTRAPYYPPDPRCRRGRGFHHGLDIATPCGTRLFSDRWGWVVSNAGLGSAYGRNPLRLRNYEVGFDLVIGHTRKVFVKPGDRVRPGTKIAKASDSGAPDGCHLHFEKRALRGGLSTATHPREMLELKVKRKKG
ncbi:M23 family metallopeptidase [Nocardioides sp. GCM10027113]|uniref:M23 family metallopeptidase n=1 Tax=unclassified Nocardioides TaxID=2615069 RepID=UPI0036145DD3